MGQVTEDNVDCSDLSAILSCQVNLFRSIKRKERLQKSSTDVIKKRIRQEQTRRENAKERMRITRLKNVKRKTFKELMRAVESLTGLVCLRNLSSQCHALSALFVTDVSIESQLLYFLKISIKN